jgi:PAS domain S-box-containing protein
MRSRLTHSFLLSSRTLPLLIVRFSSMVAFCLAMVTAIFDVKAADLSPLLFLGDKDYAPVSFLDNGISRGMDVDLVKALAAPMNREIRIELMDWNLAQEKLLRGEANGLIGMSITDDRKERFDFASATFIRDFSLLARNGDRTIRGISDLKGKKVGVTRGGFPRQLLEMRPEVNLVFVQNYNEGLNQLKAKGIDAVAADIEVAAYLIEKSGLRGISFVGKPFASAPAAIAVRSGDTALLKEINRALNRLRADGTITEIESHWRPHEMLFFSRGKFRRMVTLAAVPVIVLLLGGMGLWILTLKKQIGSRKKAERELQESEQRLRTLTDASFEGIAVCKDGILIDANDQLLKMLGYERSEIIGRPVIDLVAPESRELVQRVTQSGRTEPYEHQARRKNGTTFTVEVCGRAISTSPHLVRVTAVRDISERKQSEERLQLLQMITMDVAAAKDVAAALEVVLRRVCEKTGWVLGQAWMSAKDGTSLGCCPAAFAADSSLDEFRHISSGSIFRPGTGLPGQVWESRQPVWMRDVTQELNFPRAEAARRAGLKAGLGVPIISENDVLAVLEFFLRERRQEDERLVKLITTVAAQIGLLVERKRAEEKMRASREELRALAGRLQAVREEERTRIAREIHDVLAQELTRLKIDLGWLGKRLADAERELDHQAVSSKIAQLNSLADGTISTVQRIAAELRPVVLDSLGLVAAIEWQAEDFQARTGIRCEAILPNEELELSREAATGIFRIVQESLTNVIRHSGATKVEIALEVDQDRLQLIVRDNGVGFDEARMSDVHSLGLLGMRERALLLNAEFQIRGEKGKGTEVNVSMPLLPSPMVNLGHPHPNSVAA